MSWPWNNSSDGISGEQRGRLDKTAQRHANRGLIPGSDGNRAVYFEDAAQRSQFNPTRLNACEFNLVAAQFNDVGRENFRLDCFGGRFVASRTGAQEKYQAKQENGT